MPTVLQELKITKFVFATVTNILTCEIFNLKQDSQQTSTDTDTEMCRFYADKTFYLLLFIYLLTTQLYDQVFTLKK